MILIVQFLGTILVVIGVLRMMIQLLQCLTVWFSLTRGIQGDSIMRMPREMDALHLIKQTELYSQIRMRRDLDDCSGSLQTLAEESVECTKNAALQYLNDMYEDKAWKKIREVPADYNKSDYYARKTCNYLTTVMQDCFSCLPGHIIAQQKDHLVMKILHSTENIPDFDGQKCPVTKEFLDRNSGGLLAGSTALVILSCFLIYSS